MNQSTQRITYRARRSCLYMPGSNSRAIAKSDSLKCDAVIFDLEDAVAPEAKEMARKAVCEAVSAKDFGRREVVIRINAPGSPWWSEDLKQAVRAKPDAILLPKVGRRDDIITADQAITDAGAHDGLALWAMIEMPLAILNLGEIAASKKDSRLAAFVMGTNDLAKEMQVSLKTGRAALQTALQFSLTAARAYGLAAIDGVYNDIDDSSGLEDECMQGRELGFDGKTAIHPAQLEICNRVFAPNDTEVQNAHAIVAAFDDPANRGKGVINLNGKMTELLHLEEARRILAIAHSIDRDPNIKL